MPIFHYKTETLISPDSDEILHQSISSFVVPGQLLITLPTKSAGEQEEITEQTDKQKDSVDESQGENKAEQKSADFVFDYGEGVDVLEDEKKVLSSRYGYPEVRISSSGKLTKYFVSVKPLIDVSSDKMEATITVLPAVKGEAIVSVEQVASALEHLRIQFGVDQGVIETVLNQVAEQMYPVSDTIIARGRAPIHGKDAALRFEIEIGPIAGKELANGNIDFRERRMFVGVDQNQLIATKISRTRGTSGVNLFGDEIPPVEGKDLPVQVSDDARFLEEENVIIAAEAGIVSVVNENSIRVSSKQKIDGNIDFSTGNIRSQNAVEISGSILPDFQVSCKGDLLIGGSIDQAKVNTQGNLVVKGGIIGQDTIVRVKGDADVNYIERAQLAVRGNVVLRANAYYATVQADGNLLCPDNVKLIGGEVVVGGSITIGQIGSDSAEPMTIAAGVNPRRFQRYNELRKEYFELVHKLQSLSRRHGQNGESNIEISIVREDIHELELELTALNLVSEVGELSLGEKECFISSAELKVHGLIAAGTTVMIGNDIKELDRDFNSVRIYMSSKSGEIEITDF